MSWFKRTDSPAVATRLTCDEAIGIAREAAGDDFLAQTMTHAVPADDGGTVRWTVSSVAIDASLTIVVDDATGVVVDRRHQSGLPGR